MGRCSRGCRPPSRLAVTTRVLDPSSAPPGLHASAHPGAPSSLQVGRYHSLHTKPAKQPACLRTTAITTDGCVMAIQHTSLPVAAVQFHPESILTPHSLGMQMISNALNNLKWAE